MKQKIAITALTSISPLGNTPDAVWNHYLSDKTLITSQEFNQQSQFVARISSNLRKEIEALRLTDIKYKGLDETVLMAILVSRQAIKRLNGNKVCLLE
jgi:3-oxoacyl-(acyl-carrier-protein) synthase